MRLRLREGEIDRERKLKVPRDTLKTQRFRLGFSPFFFFSPLLAVSACLKKKEGKDKLAAVSRTRTTRARQANCRVRAFLATNAMFKFNQADCQAR